MTLLPKDTGHTIEELTQAMEDFTLLTGKWALHLYELGFKTIIREDAFVVHTMLLGDWFTLNPHDPIIKNTPVIGDYVAIGDPNKFRIVKVTDIDYAVRYKYHDDYIEVVETPKFYFTPASRIPEYFKYPEENYILKDLVEKLDLQPNVL